MVSFDGNASSERIKKSYTFVKQWPTFNAHQENQTKKYPAATEECFTLASFIIKLHNK